jgi:hypothetical protein
MTKFNVYENGKISVTKTAEVHSAYYLEQLGHKLIAKAKDVNNWFDKVNHM